MDLEEKRYIGKDFFLFSFKSPAIEQSVCKSIY